MCTQFVFFYLGMGILLIGSDIKIFLIFDIFFQQDDVMIQTHVPITYLLPRWIFAV